MSLLYCLSFVQFLSIVEKSLSLIRFLSRLPYFYFSPVWYYAVINEIFSLINAKKQKQLKRKTGVKTMETIMTENNDKINSSDTNKTNKNNLVL